MTSAGQVGTTRLGVSGEMTGRTGGVLRRGVALVAASVLFLAVAPGTNWTATPVDPRPGIAVIGAERAWSRATGRGVTVALMDTGVARHPDLDGSVVAQIDFVGDGAIQLDPSGHGTFVAGLIAAHGETFKGVAPDAKLVSL